MPRTFTRPASLGYSFNDPLRGAISDAQYKRAWRREAAARAAREARVLQNDIADLQGVKATLQAIHERVKDMSIQYAAREKGEPATARDGSSGALNAAQVLQDALKDRLHALRAAQARDAEDEFYSKRKW